MKNELIKKNGLENAYIRAAAWRGSEQMGIDVGETKTHMAIAAWDWGSYFDSEARDRGISLMTSKWAKPAPNTAPTNSKTASLYNLSAMAKLEAKKSGYTDAFMMDHEGFIAESSGANIFFVKDGALHTPTADRFLNGITRQTVIGLAKDRGIEVVERRMMPEEIKDVQEVFLTGTAAEVTAVGKIDDTQYQVGQVTRQLRDDYESLVRS
jgi:branched-chain amino acid aminotransferase